MSFKKWGTALAVCFGLAGCGGADGLAPTLTAPNMAMGDPHVLAACRDTKNAKGTPVAEASGKLNDAFVRETIQNPSDINLLLDCTLLKIPAGDANERELRLLRGHVLTVMATRYAAFNLTGRVGPSLSVGFKSYNELPHDAAEIIAKVYDAELGLRNYSTLYNPPAADTLPSPTPDVDLLVNRMAPILVLAVKAEMPTYRRGMSLLKTVASALSGDVFQAADAMKVVMGGVYKAAVMDTLGPAYILDARQNLAQAAACVNDASTCQAWEKAATSPLRAHWDQWDQLLNTSCSQMAHLAVAQPRCLPSAEEVKKGFVY